MPLEVLIASHNWLLFLLADDDAKMEKNHVPDTIVMAGSEVRMTMKFSLSVQTNRMV